MIVIQYLSEKLHIKGQPVCTHDNVASNIALDYIPSIKFIFIFSSVLVLSNITHFIAHLKELTNRAKPKNLNCSPIGLKAIVLPNLTCTLLLNLPQH
jgi:hypothetical protein